MGGVHNKVLQHLCIPMNKLFTPKEACTCSPKTHCARGRIKGTTPGRPQQQPQNPREARACKAFLKAEFLSSSWRCFKRNVATPFLNDYI